MNHSHHDHKSHHDDHKHDHHSEHEGHDHHDHHRMMIEDFKKRFWVSLALTIPVLALAPMIQGFLGVDWSFTGSMTNDTRLFRCRLVIHR